MKTRLNFQQLFLGILALSLGTLFYYFYRPTGQPYFLKFLSAGSVPGFLPPLSTTIRNSLPTFIHVAAFALITGALIGGRKRVYASVCLFWFALDALFEVCQGLDRSLIEVIPVWFAGIPFIENTKNYCLEGRFDWFDLLSIALGSFTAYLLLLFSKGGDENHGKQVNQNC